MPDSKWIIVSNRLPFKMDPQSKQLGPSSGGLVSAISGIRSDQKKVWVGIAPTGMTRSDWKEKISAKFTDYVPIFVSDEDYDKYYNGMSNDVLWPLFHYESNLTRFKWENWDVYREVNRRFADEVLKIAGPDDLIWVHDFHLFLLPHYLKQKNRNLKVGFFLHIPFPSSEIFRHLPVRQELLESVLAADLVGFHDYSYLRHFCSSLQMVLGLESSLLSVDRGRHRVSLGVFPVSIDTPKFERKSGSTEVKKALAKLEKGIGDAQVLLGVDRLDYIKGVDLKLRAYQAMLRKDPSLRGRTVLVQVAVPTRADVPEYLRLKRRVETLVGEINGEFGSPTWTPVHYIYSSVEFEDLMALYRLAKVMLVTSKRDGMNLVALEYLAAQDPKNPGVVVLSEYAGAISTLPNVIPCNPWDVVGTARRMHEALNIPQAQRVERHQPMIEYLRSYTATDWAQSFMSALERAGASPRGEQIQIQVGNGSVQLPDQLLKKIESKRKVLLLVDYDGTLVPIQQTPQAAILDDQSLNALRNLLKRKNLEMVVVSGRDGRFLAEQLGELGVDMAAEHGAQFYDLRKGRWQSLIRTNKQSWYPVANKIMRDYTARVPGSFIEKKNYSIGWHYRKSPPQFADYLGRKLAEDLEIGLANQPVTIVSGKKVVEARAVEANKGALAKWYLDSKLTTSFDDTAVIAIGDDQTDEDLFQAVRDIGVTVKVGDGFSSAEYRLPDQKDVYSFISKVTRAVQ